ncbi:MAG: Asp23/Gls24 family envelope stress response protein [Ruminococcaceae bacterium]|nr:Asp23/Gls24 family envelope stress response protein [Oscillospiraceae bacterium]
MPENYISSQSEKGTINISEEVVVSMVRAAINEIDGVATLTNNTGVELAELLGIKSPSKCVKVQIENGIMNIDTIIMVRYGMNVVNVANQVQESVTNAVESMTGMGTPVVNVHVSGVAFDK